MDNMITIVVPINAKQEHRETVRNRLIDLTAKTRMEKGNMCYVLHEATARPSQFVIYERWKDQAALDFHMEQDYLKNFIADSDSLLTQPISGTICKEVKVIA